MVIRHLRWVKLYYISKFAIDDMHGYYKLCTPQ